MADVAEEVGQELLNTVAKTIFNDSSPSGEGEEDDFKDLRHFDEEPFFHHDKGFPTLPPETDAHGCQRLLWITVQPNIRVWDLIIFLPCSAYLTFLLAGLSGARSKLRASSTGGATSLFGAFYSIVLCVAVACTARAFASICLLGLWENADVADRILWLLLRCCLLAMEIWVLLLSFSSAASDRKVVAMIATGAIVWTAMEAAFELGNPDATFAVDNSHLYGHGGLVFWTLTSGLEATAYALALVLLQTCCPQLASALIPGGRTLHRYAAFMTVVYTFQCAGTASVLLWGFLDGLCIANLAFYLYLTLFAPVVYMVFLRSFLSNGASAQPQLLFAYRAQVSYDHHKEPLRAPNRPLCNPLSLPQVDDAVEEEDFAIAENQDDTPIVMSGSVRAGF